MGNGPAKVRYSAVIPVYNSQQLVGKTIERTIALFESLGDEYEVIAVNDGSRDGSWEVLRSLAAESPRVVAIDLLRNYGQHTAVLCGLKHSAGDYAITLDDDLQNPPEEMRHLIDKAAEGYDLVIGRFREKRHARYRRIGTAVIGFLNTRIFDKPKDLVLSNFRLIRHDVVTRMCGYQTNYPYIPGLALMFARNPTNVLVEHHGRESGTSQYTLRKIAQLVFRLLFSYSVYPLRLVSWLGSGVAGLSFVLGTFYLSRALLVGTTVPGWATVVVLLSFFNGLALLCLALLGEYTVRILNQVSGQSAFYVREIVRR
jgi:glycosyltransferase involved in cell wall biosynthesis